LIGDFGGGTSDFCLIELGPSSGGGRDRRETIRGVAGGPFPGGAFGGRPLPPLGGPQLGLGTGRRSEHGQGLRLPACGDGSPAGAGRTSPPGRRGTPWGPPPPSPPRRVPRAPARA